MVVGARKRAHTTRAKGTPIAEEVDGLAAKFIGNAWHFRVYADIIAQYKEEGFVPKGERELGEIPAEDYEEDSFCCDDDESVGDPSDSDPDGEYAAAAKKKKQKQKKKKKKAANKKKKKTSRKRIVTQKRSADSGDDAIEDDAAQRTAARRLSQAIEDRTLDELLDAADAPSASAAAAVEVHEKASRGKSKGKKKTTGAEDTAGAWDTDAIDRTVATPKTAWPAYDAVRARAHEALKPVHRLGAAIPDDEFGTMLAALLKIARHILTPFAAVAAEASQVMSISRTVGEEVKSLVSSISATTNTDVVRTLKESKKHFYRIIEFFVCTAVFVKKITVREGVDVLPGARCIWTNAPIAPGQTVFRVRAFTTKPDAHVARIMYVSEASDDYPERYIDALSALRAHRHWHFVFMRKMLDWQTREYFSASVTADMRMQRFLDSSGGAQAAATTLAEFFARKHVINHCFGKK